MERRDFLLLSAAGAAAAGLSACGSPDHPLIRFLPETELVPGIATWRPSVCTLCPGGCGTSVRVMAGDVEVTREGQRGVIRAGLAKKIEGAAAHPVSAGAACARGQAALQITYHPDRVRHPLRRRGLRGAGEFEAISWDEAMSELHRQASGAGGEVVTVAGRQRGARRWMWEGLARALGAPAPVFFEFFEDAVLRRANALSFGRDQVPSFDLARCNYVLNFGSDFLGTWNSPVAQARAYGVLRQGRVNQRGRLIQVEARMSDTGANADQWVPANPGTEGVLALSIAQVIHTQHLRPGSALADAAGAHLQGWGEGLPAFAPEMAAGVTGVPAARIHQLAHDLAAHSPAVAIIAGPALAHSNALFSALAVNALNALLGSVEQPGGLYFTPAPPGLAFSAREQAGSSHRELLARLAIAPAGPPPKLLFLDGANPVYAWPGNAVPHALGRIPFIVSFGSFVDETSAYADLILPDHSGLESWMNDIPESGAAEAVFSVAPPAMQPLHDTRATPDVILALAGQLGGKAAQALPWKTYADMLRALSAPLLHQKGSVQATDPDDFWSSLQSQGGWWGAAAAPAAAAAAPEPPQAYAAPAYAGDEKEYPFLFLPYESQQFLDGALANLPWLQEMPAVLSTVMWGSWVEINLQTAQRLGIAQGDLVEVASAHGTVRAPALPSPGIAPNVIAMPAGQGHQQYTRYASGRGANPARVLAPALEPATGSLAWADTRVKITRLGAGRLALYSGSLWGAPRSLGRRF